MSFLKRFGGKKKSSDNLAGLANTSSSSKHGKDKDIPADIPVDEESKRRDRNLSISRSGRHKVKRTQRSSVLEREFYSSPETSPVSANPPTGPSSSSLPGVLPSSSSSSSTPSTSTTAAGPAKSSSKSNTAAAVPIPSAINSGSGLSSTPVSSRTYQQNQTKVSSSTLTSASSARTGNITSSSSRKDTSGGGGSCRDKTGNALLNASKNVPSQATAV